MMEETVPGEIDIESFERETTTGRETGNEESDGEKALRDAFIQKEEKNVYRAKVAVGGAIVACAAIVSCSVYFFAKQNDKNTFEVEVRCLLLH